MVFAALTDVTSWSGAALFGLVVWLVRIHWHCPNCGRPFDGGVRQVLRRLLARDLFRGAPQCACCRIVFGGELGEELVAPPAAAEPRRQRTPDSWV